MNVIHARTDKFGVESGFEPVFGDEGAACHGDDGERGAAGVGADAEGRVDGDLGGGGVFWLEYWVGDGDGDGEGERVRREGRKYQDGHCGLEGWEAG